MPGRFLLGMLALTLGGLFATVGATQDQNKMITNAIGMKLTLIPAGKFLMGSPTDEAERDADEGQHEVVITKPFYMGVYEVTQREYERGLGKNVSVFNPKSGGSLDHPVE